MALTRAMLKGMGLTDEQVGAIIEEHTSITEALKKQRDDFKEDADKLPDVKKDYENLKKEYEDLKNSSGNDEWQVKYEKEHEDFEKFKSDIADKERISNVKSAYKKLLTDCKVGEKHIDSILRVTDYSKMKLLDDGTLDDIDELKKAVESDWSGFITSERTDGASVETPPQSKATGDNKSSRAAELAAKYHDNLYGKIKED